MWALSRTSSRRRGIGTVLATIVFIFIMIFTTGNLLVWSIIQASNYQIATDEMRDRDFNKQIESLRITDVFFGDSSRFTVGTSTSQVYSGTTSYYFSSSSTTASDWPIQNMNISSTSGWFFNKIMPSGVSVGFSGGFDTQAVGTGAIGSPSGPGVMFMALSYNQSAATFKGNWSINFYIDPSRYTTASTGYMPSSTVVVASWAHILPISLWNAALQSVRTRLILTNQSWGTSGMGASYIIDSKSYIDVTAADVAWNYSRGLAVTGGTGARIPRDFWGTVGHPQYVTLTISVTVTAKIAATTTEFRIYLDDVGIRFDYTGTAIIRDYQFKLPAGVNRGLLLRIDPSFARSYSVANVHQVVYMYDYDVRVWVTISDAFVSQTALNITLPLTGLDIPRFVNSSGGARMRINSSSVNSFTLSSSSVSLGYFISDLNKLSIVFANAGPITAHAVSLWVIDPSGQTNFDSTTSTKFDLQIGAGKTGVVAALSFTWTRGVNTFKVITERGNVISFQTNA